jgi:transposase
MDKAYALLSQEFELLKAWNEDLVKIVLSQSETISKLELSLAEALSKLSKNSGNSSKPPSSDMVRTKSLRISSDKSQGGQVGHKGSTLPFKGEPDKIVVHLSPSNCSCCGHDLKSVPVKDYERRQVYDIPPVAMEVTEHRVNLKCCPHCQTENKGSFPATVSQPVQYGNHLKQFALYLSHYQFIPYGRIAQLIKDFTGHSLSEGTVVNFVNQFDKQLSKSGFVDALKAEVLGSGLVNFDETGFYYDNNRNWLHVATTNEFTYYFPHHKRGGEAMEAMDILPRYKGVAVHDYWKSYLKYDCTHALCNVHHLRDLTFCEEQEKSKWASDMKAFLLETKAATELCKELGMSCMDSQEVSQMEAKYDALIEKGFIAHPVPEKEIGKRGLVKKSKTQNLLERFKVQKEDVLRFAKDFSVPFGNNIAEQAMRMMKLKQKISGCFRSEHGAEAFAAARSYIDTARKHGCSIFDAILKNIENETLFPWYSSENTQPSG